MKQLIQFSKALRRTAGRFLAAALVAVTVLSFNTQLRAGPGQGAIVTHFDPDGTGHYEAFSPDGLLKLDVANSGQSDFVRQNADGTWTLQIAQPRAVVTLSVPVGNDEWAPVWVGIGAFHVIGRVEPTGDGFFNFTDQATSLHVQAKLTNVIDGSEWSLLVVAAIQDYEFKELKIELQPR